MIFRRALVRLTVTYSVIQLALFGAFAIGVYGFVVSTFDYDAAEQDGSAATNAAEAGFASLRLGLILGYLALLVLVPLVSWVMARRALAPIRESYESQQSFIDNASHELRTPLSVIRGELELALSREREPAEYRAAIRKSLDSSERLSRLTADLLMLARGASESIHAGFAAVDISALIERIATEQRLRHPDAQIDITVERHLSVRGSAPLLERVVANLIDNAAKFSGGNAVVLVEATKAAGIVSITVTDRGIGMDARQQAHAMNRFWRADSSRTVPGSGLGLALVDDIVRVHGGRFGLESALGAGTIARVELAVAPVSS